MFEFIRNKFYDFKSHQRKACECVVVQQSTIRSEYIPICNKRKEKVNEETRQALPNHETDVDIVGLKREQRKKQKNGGKLN